jgi:hypothetical protein
MATWISCSDGLIENVRQYCERLCDHYRDSRMTGIARPTLFVVAVATALEIAGPHFDRRRHSDALMRTVSNRLLPLGFAVGISLSDARMAPDVR